MALKKEEKEKNKKKVRKWHHFKRSLKVHTFFFLGCSLKEENHATKIGEISSWCIIKTKDSKTRECIFLLLNLWRKSFRSRKKTTKKIKNNDNKITEVCQWKREELGVAKMKSGLKITQFELECFMPSKAYMLLSCQVFLLYIFFMMLSTYIRTFNLHSMKLLLYLISSIFVTSWFQDVFFFVATLHLKCLSFIHPISSKILRN